MLGVDGVGRIRGQQAKVRLREGEGSYGRAAAERGCTAAELEVQ